MLAKEYYTVRRCCQFSQSCLVAVWLGLGARTGRHKMAPARRRGYRQKRQAPRPSDAVGSATACICTRWSNEVHWAHKLMININVPRGKKRYLDSASRKRYFAAVAFKFDFHLPVIHLHVYSLSFGSTELIFVYDVVCLCLSWLTAKLSLTCSLTDRIDFLDRCPT